MTLRISHFRFKKKYRQCKTAGLNGCPQKRGIVFRLFITTPRKPNSAKRKTARVRLQMIFMVGFFISQEEKKRGKPLSVFWKEISEKQKLKNIQFRSRASLYEAKTLYCVFKRFVKKADNRLNTGSTQISPSLSKGHLLLIARHYKRDIERQQIFIAMVKNESLTINGLKNRLRKQIPSKGEEGVLLIVGRFKIRRSYDLSLLKIDPNWSENLIRAHIVTNIVTFMEILFGEDNWAFVLNESFVIGGTRKYPDLVFYDLVEHRYVIVELKCTHLTTDLDRATSQVAVYQLDYDKNLNSFQGQTVGLILGKKAINKEYFNSTHPPALIFYSSFQI